jgi:hypothetical protein
MYQHQSVDPTNMHKCINIGRSHIGDGVQVVAADELCDVMLTPPYMITVNKHEAPRFPPSLVRLQC